MIKFKPLLFTTTLRNPIRIKYFLKVLERFENKILTNDVVIEYEVNLIKEKIYKPLKSLQRLPQLNEKYNSAEPFTMEEAWKLQKACKQHHKEWAFDFGWPSRGATHMGFLRTLGFAFYYEPNIKDYGFKGKVEPVKISKLGKLLAKCAKFNNKPEPWNDEVGISDEEKAIFANALAKYQRGNPFISELNKNRPLSLLIRTIKLLNNDKGLKSHGISRKEIPLVIGWKNNDAEELFLKIKKIRTENNGSVSDDVILDAFDDIFDGKRFNSFQNTTIMNDYADEFIRKMYLTGLFTIRGGGRYFDINKLNSDICDHIVKNYSDTKNYIYKDKNSEKDYFEYISTIDRKFFSFNKRPLKRASMQQLDKWIKIYNWEKIKNELRILQSKKEKTNDATLKILDRDVRFEFLAAIAVRSQCHEYEVKPNYRADDQGLPTSTAAGGRSDIECDFNDLKILLEVTLKTDATGQIEGELVKIRGHINYQKKLTPSKNIESLFVAPTIHDEAIHVAHELYREPKYNLMIEAINIEEFIEKLEKKSLKCN